MNTLEVKTMSFMRGENVNFPVGTIEGTPGVDFVRKSDLQDGSYYYGNCRNASCAKWSTSESKFIYLRHKFGSTFPERINHPEDDDGFDLFVPFFKCYPEKSQVISTENLREDG